MSDTRREESPPEVWFPAEFPQAPVSFVHLILNHIAYCVSFVYNYITYCVRSVFNYVHRVRLLRKLGWLLFWLALVFFWLLSYVFVCIALAYLLDLIPRSTHSRRSTNCTTRVSLLTFIKPTLSFPYFN